MTSSILCDRCGFACDFLVLVVTPNTSVPVGWCPTCIDDAWEDD